MDLENTIGEQLHGEFDEHGDFWIYRHQADSNRSQLKEWFKETNKKRDKSNVIKLFPDMTIG